MTLNSDMRSIDGFILPENIHSYYCDKCEIIHNQSPSVKVSVRDKGATVGYRCCACDRQVYVRYLSSAEGIDPKYIVFDETGDFKPPTPEDIESMLKRAKESAEKGEGSFETGGYTYPFEQALRWAGKIGYEIPAGLVEELKQNHRKAYLDNFTAELPAKIEAINKIAYGFSLEEIGGAFSDFYGTGLGILVDELYETLPHISLPEDPEVKEGILRILFAYKDMCAEELDATEKMEEEIKKHIENQRKGINDTNTYIMEYITQAGLTLEQVENTRKTPLDKFPLD